jgi:hypothetical protein
MEVYEGLPKIDLSLKKNTSSPSLIEHINRVRCVFYDQQDVAA